MSTQPRPLPRDRAAARRELVQLLAERLVREALAQASRHSERPLAPGEQRRNVLVSGPHRR